MRVLLRVGAGWVAAPIDRVLRPGVVGALSAREIWDKRTMRRMSRKHKFSRATRPLARRCPWKPGAPRARRVAAHASSRLSLVVQVTWNGHATRPVVDRVARQRRLAMSLLFCPFVAFLASGQSALARARVLGARSCVDLIAFAGAARALVGPESPDGRARDAQPAGFCPALHPGCGAQATWSAGDA